MALTEAELAHRKELILFCEMCFASSDDSSWGGELVQGYCMNCGAGGTSLQIPRYSVEYIRRNASWVGKRYYPHEEDTENYEERERLRAQMTEFPGRTIEGPFTDKLNGPDEKPYTYFRVIQKDPTKDGRQTSMMFTDVSKEEAWTRAKLSMTWYAPEQFA